MTKKMWSLLLTGALIAGVFTAVPAQAAPEVPAVALIEDAAGDANYGGAPFSLRRADILKVWFTETTDSVSVHLLTDAAGNDPNSILYRVWLDSGAGRCIQLRGFTAGVGNAGSASASLRQRCDGDTSVEGEFLQEEGPDGTGIRTLTFPRDAHPALAAGTSVAVDAETVNYFVAVTIPQIDGTDAANYTFTGGDGAPTEPPVAEEPPGKNDPPGQGNQDCAKIKNKKKKKECKKNNGEGPDKDAGCAAYVPGELGAEAETTVVTEEATEEAPIVVEYTLGPAAGGGIGPYDTTTRVSHNVQLDSVGSEAGLFMRLETPETDDPDLYAYWNDGSEAAVAGGFNQGLVAGPVPGPAGPVVNGSGNAGESGFGYEQINGLRTADCAGWDLDLVNWAGVGGTYTLKLWVGEIQNDPTPPAKAVE